MTAQLKQYKSSSKTNMSIATQLPAPLNTFVVDVPAKTYYDFELSPDSTYPLKGVTYPVDYGNIPGYTAEDGHELDFFVGADPSGQMGYIIVDRGDAIPDEHKFYIGLTPEDVNAVISELKPVLIEHKELADIATLLGMISDFRDKP